MLATKYLFLIAAFLYCLGGALAVTCDEDPTDTACIDCTTDPDNAECATTTTPTTTTTTTTTVAPATTAAPTAAPQTTKKTGNVKKVTIKNLKYKVTRKIKVTNKSG